MNTPTLETERLILRRFTERDMEALFLILNDEEVNKYLPWHPVKSIEEARKFYKERYVSIYAELQGDAYAICLKKTISPLVISKLIWKNTMILDMDCAKNFGIGELLQKQVQLLWNR